MEDKKLKIKKNKISGFHLIITKFQKIIKRCKKLNELVVVLNVVVRI